MSVNFLIQNVRNEEDVGSNSLDSFLTFSSSSRGALAPAPPQKSFNISSIILYNIINTFKNYINKWLINKMVS